jgi:hypothetical protein
MRECAGDGGELCYSFTFRYLLQTLRENGEEEAEK